jgi:hypothetical protein
VTSSFRRWPALLAAVAIGWLAASGGVPLYDGLGFPDEPYRFVGTPPAGVKHGPAATVHFEISSATRNGANTERLDVSSDEQGPQVLLVLPPGAARVSAPGPVTARVDALAPDAQPADGVIDGNVYRISLGAAPTTSVTLGAGAGAALVYLRGVSLKPAAPVMEFRPAATAGWRQLRSRRSGQDVFVAAFAAPGDYALVHVRGAKAAGRSVGQEVVILVLLAGFVLLVVASVVLSRRAQRRAAETDG